MRNHTLLATLLIGSAFVGLAPTATAGDDIQVACLEITCNSDCDVQGVENSCSGDYADCDVQIKGNSCKGKYADCDYQIVDNSCDGDYADCDIQGIGNKCEGDCDIQIAFNTCYPDGDCDIQVYKNTCGDPCSSETTRGLDTAIRYTTPNLVATPDDVTIRPIRPIEIRDPGAACDSAVIGRAPSGFEVSLLP